AQDLEVKVGVVVATGNYADEEEIGFTQAGGKFLDRAAQIPATLLINVLQGIDPKSVTVGERNPVFVTAGDINENTGLVVIDIAIADKIGASKLGMRIVDIAGAEVTLTGSRVAIIRPQLVGPNTVILAFNRSCRLPLPIQPGSLLVEVGPRPKRRLVPGIGGVEPILRRVVEDHVKQHSQVMRMSGGNEIDEILPRAKTRVNLEKVLNGIAVVAIPMGALF
ncbi:MAG TPA: hypothetical protein VK638_47995, partial [Edaphobacter sp.]|nr:hypothetical protein [Edaphobacter sp.]